MGALVDGEGEVGIRERLFDLYERIGRMIAENADLLSFLLPAGS